MRWAGLGAEQLSWLKADLALAFGVDADRDLRAYSAVDGLSGVGLGHAGRGGGALLPEALRLGDGAQWAHSPGGAEGGRQCRVSHRDVDRISAACAGHGAARRADGGSGGKAEERAGSHRSEVRRAARATWRSSIRRWRRRRETEHAGVPLWRHCAGGFACCWRAFIPLETRACMRRRPRSRR